MVLGDDGCDPVPYNLGRIVLYSIGQTGFFTNTQDLDNLGDMPCRRRSKVGGSLDDDSTPSRRDKPLVQEHSGKGRFKRVSPDRIVWTRYIFWGWRSGFVTDWVEVLQVEGFGVVGFQICFFTSFAVIFSSSAFIRIE